MTSLRGSFAAACFPESVDAAALVGATRSQPASAALASAANRMEVSARLIALRPRGLGGWKRPEARARRPHAVAAIDEEPDSHWSVRISEQLDGSSLAFVEHFERVPLKVRDVGATAVAHRHVKHDHVRLDGERRCGGLRVSTHRHHQ